MISTPKKLTTENLPELKDFLERKVQEYNRPWFIENDPISIPHRFEKKQDIEISGFFAAILAWGQRVTIINKCSELLEMMDNSPHDFMLHHQERDLIPFEKFKHRTFNATDVLYFIHFFSWYYKKYTSLETAFTMNPSEDSTDVAPALTYFHEFFFSLPDAPKRTRKHVATPLRKSACKRINMFLRWMVRKDDKGVDFGLWASLRPSQLVCPCDLHVDRVARMLGLIQRKQTDWLTAKELTDNLILMDADDPVKYDFALFGLGVEAKF